MFNFKFLNIFKSETKKISTNNKVDNNDKVIIELSNTYISYSLNSDSKIYTVDLEMEEHSDFDALLNLWIDTIAIIIETLKRKVDITLLIKSNNFLIKNSDSFIDDNVKLKYFSNKLALSEDNIEVIHLLNKSYMIVEYNYLQKILFAFKAYHINAIYDISILNSLMIKESKKFHLYLNISYNDSSMLLNYEKIQKRDISINLNSFINKCAKDLYVDFDTSYQNIKLSFKDITTYDELKNSTKPLQKNLLVYIDDLVDTIKNNLEYFSIYDNIKYIENIYINGDILEFDFIIKILSDKLNIDLILLNKYMKINNYCKTNLTIFNKIDKDILNKLIIDFNGLNYNDGRDEYVFIENRFISKGALTSSEKITVNKRKTKVNIENKESYLYDQNNKAIWKMGMLELFEFIKERFYKSNNTNKTSKVKNKNIIYIIGILPLILALLYIFSIIDDTQRDFNSNVKILEDRIQRVDILKKSLVSKNKQFDISRASRKIDKIFWTQKLITIANLMPNEIWLSSLTLENKIKRIENKEVTTQSLVLESRALPSSIGHISTIALYMDKLLVANNTFKKDFSSINFGGADIVNEYGYDVINFKLLFDFEKNINIKEIEKQESKKDKSIAENLQDIKKNKQIQKKILDKL